MSRNFDKIDVLFTTRIIKNNTMGIKELVERLSSYNLFNYFFPGMVFVILLREITHYDLYQKDLLTGVFLYYFIGLVISRIGSVLIEPILWKSGFVEKINIPKLIGLIQDNIKLELLYEVSNMYRTITSMFFVLIIVTAFDILVNQNICHNSLAYIISGIAFLILFLFAFRKQNEYVYACVEKD